MRRQEERANYEKEIEDLRSELADQIGADS